MSNNLILSTLLLILIGFLGACFPKANASSALYEENCSMCHQVNGSGIPGAFPPLTKHMPELYKAEGGRDYLVNLMLYGVQGKMTIDGNTYNGVMPSWAKLNDAELAMILNYTLTAWGNQALLPDDFSVYAAKDIANRRSQNLSMKEILERRPKFR